MAGESFSVFDLFKRGIGPSSSHTVGPMRAARTFAVALRESESLRTASRLRVTLYGSLGATGQGHGSPDAVLMGLLGYEPETVDIEKARAAVAGVREKQRLALLGGPEISFTPDTDLILDGEASLPAHPNGMRFAAFDPDEREILSRVYYSIGGGFVVGEAEAASDRLLTDQTPLPYAFENAEELLRLCAEAGKSVSDIMLANEAAFRPEDETRARLAAIWTAMDDCIAAGCTHSGDLPGGLHVSRRAAGLKAALETPRLRNAVDPLEALDWVSLYALAVNEENAAGGRVVTAPTNGAAGIVPAVLKYYTAHLSPEAGPDAIARFLLTAAAVGILCKKNASISGAEVGCQGEVGSACAMAAAGLCEVLGGTPAQVENAAEIAMEHNLGLTCDPVGGLVQIPCIERNAIGAMKAIHAARMALRGDGRHFVSLDAVIRTMLATGRDMADKYKETSRGGLAVNITEC